MTFFTPTLFPDPRDLAEALRRFALDGEVLWVWHGDGTVTFINPADVASSSRRPCKTTPEKTKQSVVAKQATERTSSDEMHLDGQ
jgi:hypothetical protein